MEEFNKVLYTTLKKLNLPVFHEDEQRGTSRPFIIYQINERTRTDNPRILSVSVIVEDSSITMERADSIISSIDRLLDRKVIDSENHLVRFIRQAQNSLGDPQPLIKRIELSYQLRALKK